MEAKNLTLLLNPETQYYILCRSKSGGLIALEAFSTDAVLRASRVDFCIQDQWWHVDPVGGEKFKFSCFTKFGGWRYVEADPKDDIVRPSKQDDENQDQVWYLEKVENLYKICCETKNGGLRCLEAIPKAEGGPRVRPGELQDGNQDQLWDFVPIRDLHTFKKRYGDVYIKTEKSAFEFDAFF